MKANNTAYLCLGSNMGNRKKNLQIAIEEIEKFAKITKRSSLYETEPEEYRNQANFLNQALKVKTSSNPLGLISEIQKIEKKMGRKREIEKGPRNIDIDIIFYNHEIVKEKNLNIPHPSFDKRNFVLTAIEEIEPRYIDPLSRKSVRELKENLVNPSKVTLWT